VPVPPVFGAASAYKADIAARVRRFVRFLEDQGYVEVDDGIDDLPRHLADYFDAIDSLQLARDRHSPIDPRPSISWPGFALRDDGGPISMTRSSTSTPRMIAAARSGASGASWSPRARSGGGAALGTSSSSLRGRGVIPSVEPVADDDPHMAAYLAWLKQHRGATDETIRRYRADITRLMPMLGEPSQWDAAASGARFNDEARRRRVRHHCSSR
jgi:hypothetical protein